MTLDDINTSGFKFDPKSKTFQNDMETIEEFKFTKTQGLSKRKLLTYIALMCDPKSDIRKNFNHYGARKKNAALCAGFNIQNNDRFKSELEAILVGKVPEFNKAFIKYLSLSYDTHFVRLNLYQQLSYIMFEKAYTGDVQAVKLIDILVEKQEKEEAAILEGKESGLMIEELYKQAEQKKLGIKPEDIAYGLSKGKTFAEFSKYGKEYGKDFLELGKLRFTGDEIPEKDV